jgi:hypothetical protein
MKANRKIIAVLFVLVLSSVIFPKQASAQSSQVSFQVFYNQLSPYGQWVDYLNYGDVWVPNVGSDFVPYSTDGHWVLSDYGWTWVSDYSWGWAPFHYGRWGNDNSLGWFWVPDTEWGPSWVSWRSNNDYYGWEPMAPGVTISAGFGGGNNRYNDHWMFVRKRDIERSNINRYYANRTDHNRIMQNSKVINTTHTDNSRHATYVSGPAREDVQKAIGRKITPVTIRDNNKKGQVLSNGQLRIYRPIVTRNKAQNTAPLKTTNLRDVKKPSERIAPNQRHNVPSQNNNNKIQQQKASKPTISNRVARPSQRQQTNPSRNIRQEQPRNVPSQNNNNKIHQQETSKPAIQNRVARPSQRQQTNPSRNIRQEQPRNVPSQNNNNKIQQQKASKPTISNRAAKPSQRQIAMPSQRNVRSQQPNRARPQTNQRNEPPKEVRHP